MKKKMIILVLSLVLPLTVQAKFICGNHFKELCKYSFDEYGFNVNNAVDNDYWFVKTDKLEEFFAKYSPQGDYVIVSHNADHGVTDQFIPILNQPNLIHWYGQNIETRHPKLTSIPIGICNFADHQVAKEVQRKNHSKKHLVYANYELSTNPKERKKCLRETGVKLAKRKPFKDFLTDVAESYFVISPDGNGVDTHRTWEALYLRAIPIVTRTINSEFYKDLPIIIIDSWADYKKLNLTPELYYQIWGDFDPDTLTVDRFVP